MKLPLLQDVLMLPSRAKMDYALKINRWPLIDHVKQREDDKKRKEQERQNKIKSLYPLK
jgi:hypothetical protein